MLIPPYLLLKVITITDIIIDLNLNNVNAIYKLFYLYQQTYYLLLKINLYEIKLTMS